MEIGPIQLVAFGFDQPKFEGAILAELERLAQADVIRVVDAVVVHKDANGEVETRQFSGLTLEEAEELGAKVGALVGLGADGEEGIEKGAAFGAEEMDRRGGHALGEPGDWDVLEDIPNDYAAAILLVEHRWAIPLRKAIVAEGGLPLGDAWITIPDLISIGVLAREQAQSAS